MELIHRPVDELIVIKDKERSIQAMERELDAVTFEAPEAMRMAASFQAQDAQLRMGWGREPGLSCSPSHP